ncbi:murein biosynthesis integral membrane protein MurJ [Prochlorococcus sp. MIT 1300]|uniref:murein biosynthesis integral membrane protein MurJ n=1 Tax=Prochlorococcus sp. MIT 1300 TaxID=3096218 RepID=UPI002A75CE1C|nr:murein biosynthesis integral membrane protein MurJ [Prochlorococcus sp. MIT 1300]
MGSPLKQIALIVTFGTLLSKAGGLFRQLVIANAFGVGAAYEAYNYSYVLPGFLLILLGGINGPFHNAMVSVLSRLPKQERSHVMAALITLVSSTLCLTAIFLVLAADPLITLLAPGLNPEIHKIAVIQLKLMSPIAIFSGLIGLGFGSLNAAEKFWVPAISPLISSIAIISGIGLLRLQIGQEIGTPDYALLGGLVLALSSSAGAFLQWTLQIPSLIKENLIQIKFVWDWQNPAVRDVLKIMGPATLSSGMLQINVFTDLFFASGIPLAAAGLGYATLLIQTPLGLISNSLIIPLLPTFAKLNNKLDKPMLIKRISQGLMLSITSMVALATILIVMSTPIVTLIYERGAFDSNASKIVSALLIAYGIGMPAYLVRDLLVRIFYALGDARIPLNFSITGIILNIIFDWLLVGGPTPWGNQLSFNFGAPGLVFATSAINLITSIGLIWVLNKKLDGLPIKEWISDTYKILLAGGLSGLIAFSLKIGVQWPDNTFGLTFKVCLSSLIALGAFGLITSSLGVEQAKEILLVLRRRITHF